MEEKKLIDFSHLVQSVVSSEDLAPEAIATLRELVNQLEKDEVRKAIMPIFKFDSWINISEKYRNFIFESNPKLEKLYLKSTSLNANSISFRDFTTRLTDEFILRSESRSSEDCLDFLIDALSQLPTRRVLKPILLARMFPEKITQVMQGAKVERILHLLRFPLNDFTAETLSQVELEEQLETVREKVVSICWKHKQIIPSLLSGSLLFGSAEKIHAFFDSLPEPVVDEIIADAFLVNSGDDSVSPSIKRNLFANRLTNNFSDLKRSACIFPTNIQETLRAAEIRLGLQYLSIPDLVERNRDLYRVEAHSIIQSAVEDAVGRLKPRWSEKVASFVFDGVSRMALQVKKINILEVEKKCITSSGSSRVVAEVTVDVSSNVVASEWDSLRHGDCLLLVSLESHGSSSCTISRGAELIDISDEQGNVSVSGDKSILVGSRRIMKLELDPKQYDLDLRSAGSVPEPHVLVRMKDSHFKNMLKILNSISSSVPEWISDIICGYGDPNAVNPLNDPLLPIENYQAQHLTAAQEKAIASATRPGLTLVRGGPGTGKTLVTGEILKSLFQNKTSGTALVIAKSNESLNGILSLLSPAVPKEYILKPAGSSEDEYSRQSVINHMLQLRLDLLAQIKRLAVSIGSSAPEAENFAYSCDTANQFFLNRVQPLIQRFHRAVEACNVEGSSSKVKVLTELIENESFPGITNTAGKPAREHASHLLDQHNGSLETILFPFKEFGVSNIQAVLCIFEKLKECAPLEVLRSVKDRSQYLLTSQARIVALTSAALCNQFTSLQNQRFRFSSLVAESQMLEIETFLALSLQKHSAGSKQEHPLKRVVVIGDEFDLPPVVTNKSLADNNNFAQTLFYRLIRLGVQPITLDMQFRSPKEIADCWTWKYNISTHAARKPEKIHGLKNVAQFIDVPDFNQQGETQTMVHFYQNLGEAEMIVAFYMYLRLNGVDKNDVSILTSYNGQRLLIDDILKTRCGSNPLFGFPSVTTTIDQFQGQYNKVILVSLVRTQSAGHNADPRRLISAFSRASQALFVFGRLTTLECANAEVQHIARCLVRDGSKLVLRLHNRDQTVHDVHDLWEILRQEMSNEISHQ